MGYDANLLRKSGLSATSDFAKMNVVGRHRRLSAVLAADIAGYTRMMEKDPEATVAAWKQSRREVIDPAIADHDGDIVKLTGDGFLCEFPSVLDALNCALQIQKQLDSSILNFRMGLHLGDVVDDGNDIHGDGVNIAARLEAVAPPGQICISETAKDAIGGINSLKFRELGPQRLKHVSRPVRAFLVESGGDRQGAGFGSEISVENQSAVRYLLSGDGLSIAYADVGEGYPLVFAGSWMTHLEKDWENPMARHFLTHLAREFTIIRYDQRGIGMSDWDGVSYSVDKIVDDMARVIDRYEYEKVAILGASQGAVASIAYAVRHPDRVSHLILHGGYVRGRRRRNDPEAEAQSQALATLIRQGWAAKNPAFRQMITSMFMPEASPEEASWFNDFQMTSSTAENMSKVREFYDDVDISGLLEQVSTPTLVIHCSEDAISPITEGKFIASRISNSEFVLLKSNNHMIFENEPDFPLFLSSIRRFIGAGD